MSEEKKNIEVLNKKKDESCVSSLEKRIKHSIFNVVYVLLKNQTFNVWIEMILIFLQLNQLLGYSFFSTV